MTIRDYPSIQHSVLTIQIASYLFIFASNNVLTDSIRILGGREVTL